MIGNPSNASPSHGTAPVFRPEHFERVAKVLADYAGINVVHSKDRMVYSRLMRRLKALQIEDFDQYLTYLDTHPREITAFVNALTTNLTQFYRERYHFETLTRHLATQQKATNPKPLTIWCAGCSTGEEAYSIAMTCIKAFDRYDAPVQIIASDIDTEVLTIAKRGIYPDACTDRIPQHDLPAFFYRGKNHQAGKVRVVPEVSKLIRFERINLMDDYWPIPTELDIIFCRNVLIYFHIGKRQRIFQRMLSHLSRDGLYFAGHAEHFIRATGWVERVDKTVYRKFQYQSTETAHFDFS